MRKILAALICYFCLVSLSYAAFAPTPTTFNAPKLDSTAQTFVSADEAFRFNWQQEKDHLLVSWQIKPDYYLYKDKFKFSSPEAKFVTLPFPKSTSHQDEFFGNVDIYRDSVLIDIQLGDIALGDEFVVTYQGCADAGFCYPPIEKTIALQPVTIPSTSKLSTSNQLSSYLQQFNQQQWLTIISFFVLGIGLAFTPCVLPMYPIITGMILGQESRSKKQTFTLSLSYVQGMALTYTILGLIVAQAGLGFQAALQQPAILIPLSLLFILLASAMFGLFTFQLPSRWQTALAGLSNRPAGGPYLSTFIMGAISGLICSPCTTAPLSGALLYIAQTGNLLTGGLALYALALGMGMPLIAATVFGRQVLPNAGSWMEKIKVGFGFVLLSVPILLLERLLPETLIPWLWALLASSAAVWLISMVRNAKPRMKLILTFFSLALLIASWKPVVFSEHITPLPFTTVTNVQTLNAALLQARREGKPVMLDTYADWCVACKEFEKYTFSDQQVQTLLSNYTLIKIDVTDNSIDDQALLNHLQIQGLPTLLFWQADGQPNQRATINGFMTADKFIAHLRTKRDQ